MFLFVQVGASKYRDMRKKGLTALPGSVSLDSARPYSIPSREASRSIPCRVIGPSDRETPTRGIFLHFHGGGWVLNDEMSSDLYLKRMAELCRLTCISVGYRLAPENPYPAAPQDCQDVAEWLIDHGPSEFGQKLLYIGGESAGANLAVLTALSLLQSPVQHYRGLSLKGLLLHYGTFSLQWLPGTKNFHKNPPLIIDETTLTHFRAAYLPGYTQDDLTSPQVSPFFADLKGFPLPPALITSGTEDCLLEDSIFMSIRWMVAGGHATLRLYPGSPHGFIVFDPREHPNAAMALKDVSSFIEDTSTVQNWSRI